MDDALGTEQFEWGRNPQRPCGRPVVASDSMTDHVPNCIRSQTGELPSRQFLLASYARDPESSASLVPSLASDAVRATQHR